MKTSSRREQVLNVFPPGSITQPRPQNVKPHEGEREEGGAFSVLHNGSTTVRGGQLR
jgi:hypothetical protein